MCALKCEEGYRVSFGDGILDTYIYWESAICIPLLSVWLIVVISTYFSATQTRPDQGKDVGPNTWI